VSDYLVQEEDGTSKFTLEDGSGAILLETIPETPARVTQLPVEALVLGEPDARVTQLPVEALILREPSVRVTQMVVEVLLRTQYDHVQIIWIDG
jgi:hypothetical protein